MDGGRWSEMNELLTGIVGGRKIIRAFPIKSYQLHALSEHHSVNIDLCERLAAGT